MGPETSYLLEIVEMSEILVDVVSNLGALGIVLWLIVRFSNHTIPRLAKKFEEALSEARTDFKEALANQRADFFKFAEEQRDFFDTRIEAEHDKMDQFAKLLKEVRYGSTDNH